MLQTGIVKEIKSTKNTAPHASIEIIRSSACGENCSSCGLCPGKAAIVEAINEKGAAVGDTVIIQMSDKKVLGAAFLVYIVPLIMLIIGYFIGYAVFNTESASIITGLCLMAVTFAIITLVDKKIKLRYTPHIVSVMEHL